MAWRGVVWCGVMWCGVVWCVTMCYDVLRGWGGVDEWGGSGRGLVGGVGLRVVGWGEGGVG